jgi:hypothetical protein
VTEQARERTSGVTPRAPRLTALWFGLFGAPAAWTVMFMVSYGMSAHFCYPGDTPLTTSTFGGLRAALGAVVVAAIIVAAGAAVVALKSWRATTRDTAGVGRPLEMRATRPHWMALGGVLVSALFLFLILLSGVPVLLVPPCSYGA